MTGNIGTGVVCTVPGGNNDVGLTGEGLRRILQLEQVGSTGAPVDVGGIGRNADMTGSTGLASRNVLAVGEAVATAISGWIEVTRVTGQLSSSRPDATITDCRSMTGGRTVLIGATVPDRSKQCGNLGGLTGTMLLAVCYATGKVASLVVGIKIGTGMTAGAVGQILISLDAIDNISVFRMRAIGRREAVTIATVGAGARRKGRGGAVTVTGGALGGRVVCPGCWVFSFVVVLDLAADTIGGNMANLTDAGVAGVEVTRGKFLVSKTGADDQHDVGVGAHPLAVRVMTDITGIAVS